MFGRTEPYWMCGETENSRRRKDRMSDTQLYLAIGVPMIFNTLLITVLVMYVNSKLDALERRVDAKLEVIDAKLEAMNQRFDDMRDLWRAELHRVEEVLDARLKHLEAR